MNKRGFTLIELLIVIAIIGIVAAIAIPNLLSALQKGKQKATMGDMKTLGNAVESYLTDVQMAPGGGALTAVRELEIYLTPFYIKIIPIKDGWGGELQYMSGAVGPSQELYSIQSWGRDNAASVVSIADNPYTVSTMAGFENDIVYSNGNFTYGPKIR